jgi:uncharacterized protein YgbK (DUF1537 family)
MLAETILGALPPEFPGATLDDCIQDALARSGRTVVALDDDPTGVQTVHDVPVLARWDVPDLADALAERGPLFFVLTNSRSLDERDAVALNHRIVGNLREAAASTGTSFVVASRSDSTLRGHFPAETDAIADALGGVDGVLLVPAFIEGGRFTTGDVHWVRDGERLTPAGETEFARDAAFGYAASDLKHWVAEKSGGRISPESVCSISIDDIRGGGPAQVAELLRSVSDGRVVVVNAAGYRDLDVVVLGLLDAETAGKRFVYRTGASFVRARAGIAARPLLSREEIVGPAPAPLAGLVVVGSHVRKSSEQLARLLDQPAVVPIELSVPEVLASPVRRGRVLAAALAAIGDALTRTTVPVLFTSRTVEAGDRPESQLEISRAVSAALVEIVQTLDTRPGWIVAKGGITSSDIGTVGLGVRRALVLGQVRPGIPVWRLGSEARFPGLGYVVFPGNVGRPETLSEVVALLRSEAQPQAIAKG